MTCTFDREQLALFADLAGDERARVEEHVAGCAECAALLGQYRQGATLLADALVASPGPVAGLRRHARTRRPMLASVAAAVVVLLAVTMAQEPVRAAILSWFQIKEVTVEEARTIAGRTFDASYVMPLTDSVVPFRAAELEERYGLPVARPDVGPDWELVSVTVPRGERPDYIQFHYLHKTGGNLYISQERRLWERTQLVAQGMSQKVRVAGQDAWVIRGAFVKPSDTYPDGYDPGIDVDVITEWQGQELRINLSHWQMTHEQRLAEAIRIAESIMK